MLRRHFLYLLIFIMILTASLLSMAPAYSQMPSQTAPAVTIGDMDFKTANQEAVEKLSKMPPEKVAALDDKLAEALTLYYDGKFAQALPIFNSISADVETMDLMWWLGTSAIKAGEAKLAVEKFKKMLAIDPKLQRVRLELAVAYFQLRQYDEARRELEIVKQSQPPADVQKNIDKLLGAITESSKKLYWNARFSQGLQWDSNIPSGPDQKVLSVTNGTLTLQSDQAKTSGWGSIENFAGNILYDFGDKQGFMWNTTADIYNLFYFDYGKYNYTLADASTGLWWVGQRDIVKIPVGMSKQEYGSSPLSTIVHVRPSYEHYFTSYFSLRGQYVLSRESFMDTIYEGLNNTTARYEITPNFFFMNRQHIISISAGYETTNADLRQWTYTAPYGAISYYMRLPSKTDIFLKYQYGERDYKAAPVLFTEERVDRRHSISAVISQEFLKYFFASFAFNYIDNYSNIELYSFRKQTYTFSLGCYF